MTTIIVINAISSLVATAGVGGYIARRRRRSPRAVVKPVYVTTKTTRPRPPR